MPNYIFVDKVCQLCSGAYRTRKGNKTCHKCLYHANKHKYRESINGKAGIRLAENRESINRRRREIRCDRHRLVKKLWVNANREKVNSQSRISKKKWRLENPDKCRLSVMANRTKRKNATVENVTPDQIEALKVKQQWRCAICKERHLKFHVDHIKPIARGGGHEIKNLQLLCRRCNQNKSSYDPIDYMQKLGFLL